MITVDYKLRALDEKTPFGVARVIATQEPPKVILWGVHAFVRDWDADGLPIYVEGLCLDALEVT